MSAEMRSGPICGRLGKRCPDEPPIVQTERGDVPRLGPSYE